jgi:hypothetical protein
MVVCSVRVFVAAGLLGALVGACGGNGKNPPPRSDGGDAGGTDAGDGRPGDAASGDAPTADADPDAASADAAGDTTAPPVTGPYVSPTLGQEAGPGTLASPYKSIEKALLAAKPGRQAGRGGPAAARDL